MQRASVELRWGKGGGAGHILQMQRASVELRVGVCGGGRGGRILQTQRASVESRGCRGEKLYIKGRRSNFTGAGSISSISGGGTV